MFENWKLTRRIVTDGYKDGVKILMSTYIEVFLVLTHEEFRTEILGKGSAKDPDTAFEIALKNLYTAFHQWKEYGRPGSFPRKEGGVNWLCAWDPDLQAWYIETENERRYEKGAFTSSPAKDWHSRLESNY